MNNNYYQNIMPNGLRNDIPINDGYPLLTDIMRVYVEGMRSAFQLGRQLKEENKCLVSTKYLGVYDDASYGVYDSLEQLQYASKHWNKETTQVKSFASYYDALSFARCGIANNLNGIESSIPPLTHPMNWREKVIAIVVDKGI